MLLRWMAVAIAASAAALAAVVGDSFCLLRHRENRTVAASLSFSFHRRQIKLAFPFQMPIDDIAPSSSSTNTPDRQLAKYIDPHFRLWHPQRYLVSVRKFHLHFLAVIFSLPLYSRSHTINPRLLYQQRGELVKKF